MAWRSLAAWGFSMYEINRAGQIRAVGSTEIRAVNEDGALGLVHDDGRKRFRAAGKLCRLAFGPSAPGASRPAAKLTPEQVAEIRTRPDAPTMIAAEFGVSTSAVKAARTCQTWQSVEVEPLGPGQYQTDRAAMQAA